MTTDRIHVTLAAPPDTVYAPDAITVRAGAPVLDPKRRNIGTVVDAKVVFDGHGIEVTLDLTEEGRALIRTLDPADLSYTSEEDPHAPHD